LHLGESERLCGRSHPNRVSGRVWRGPQQIDRLAAKRCDTLGDVRDATFTAESLGQPDRKVVEAAWTVRRLRGHRRFGQTQLGKRLVEIVQPAAAAVSDSQDVDEVKIGAGQLSAPPGRPCGTQQLDRALEISTCAGPQVASGECACEAHHPVRMFRRFRGRGHQRLLVRRRSPVEVGDSLPVGWGLSVRPARTSSVPGAANPLAATLPSAPVGFQNSATG
jgi:hypothetical protein